MVGILPDLETESSSDPMKGFSRPARTFGGPCTIAWLNRCRRLAKDWGNLNRRARLHQARVHSTHGLKTLSLHDAGRTRSVRGLYSRDEHRLSGLAPLEELNQL